MHKRSFKNGLYYIIKSNLQTENQAEIIMRSDRTSHRSHSTFIALPPR